MHISHNHLFIISTTFKMVREKNDLCTSKKFQNRKLGYTKHVPFPPKAEQLTEQNNSYFTSVLQPFVLCYLEERK